MAPLIPHPVENNFWQFYKMASWQNGKLMLFEVDKMVSWQNGELTKWQVDKMASWQNGKLKNWPRAIKFVDFSKKFHPISSQAESNFNNCSFLLEILGSDSQNFFLSSYDHLMIILWSSYDHLMIILWSSYDHLMIIL